MKEILALICITISFIVLIVVIWLVIDEDKKRKRHKIIMSRLEEEKLVMESEQKITFELEDRRRREQIIQVQIDECEENHLPGDCEFCGGR